MEQSPSSEANLFSASQEISRILWKPKVHYRIHKGPPLVPVPSQLDPVHTRTSHFLITHLHNILPCTPLVFTVVIFPQVSPSKLCIRLSYPHTCYMPRSSHSSRFCHPSNIEWGVQITKLLSMSFSPFPCHLVPLRPKYSPQHPLLKHSQPTFLPQYERPSFTPIQNNRQNYISVYLNL